MFLISLHADVEVFAFLLTQSFAQSQNQAESFSLLFASIIVFPPSHCRRRRHYLHLPFLHPIPTLFFYRSNLQPLLLPEMAYVDHAFSITDEDIMMDSPFTVNNRPPIKEIALAVSLLVFGMIGIIVGAFMASNRVGGDRVHGTLLFPLLFFPVLPPILP